ncbi:unnamed protein product, partial [Strongylus vulgaris]
TSSKSPQKRCSDSLGDAAADRSAEIYEPESSDDDGGLEEDEVFTQFGEDDAVFSCEVDEDVVDIKNVVTHTQLKVSELESYAACFAEYQNGAHAKRPATSVAYPELFQRNAQVGFAFVQTFCEKFKCSRLHDREVVVHEIARARTSTAFRPRVVYDLDSFANEEKRSQVSSITLTNNDSVRAGHVDKKVDHLLFESRFECGNLRRATQVGPTHYELILSPDINQKKEHYQWFYFEVSNVINDVPYTFEIINCLKTTSMYSKGMQPVMYSVCDALAGHRGWVRAGDCVCYYRNLYTSGEDSDVDESKSRKRGFYSIRFNITFHNKGDICYFAYHFPYTYSFLKTSLSRYLSQIPSNLYYSNDTIGESLGGNPLNLLTITAQGSREQVSSRDIVFLSSRVHPGESNSSWMMHGKCFFLEPSANFCTIKDLALITNYQIKQGNSSKHVKIKLK